MQWMGNSGCFPQGNRAAIVRHYSVGVFLLCAVFSYFCNPPNSHIDYRMFNICDHSYGCVYTQGLGTPTMSQHNILTHRQQVSTTFWVTDNELAQHFDYHKFFLCSGQGSNLGSLDLESMLLPLSHPVTKSKTHITVTVEHVSSYIIQFWRLQWGRQHKVEETERAPAGQSHVVALGQVPQGVESLRGPGRGGQGGDGHHGHVPWGRPHLPSHVQQQHQQQQTATIGGRDDRPSSHRKQGCWRYMCVCVYWLTGAE